MVVAHAGVTDRGKHDGSLPFATIHVYSYTCVCVYLCVNTNLCVTCTVKGWGAGG